MQPAQGLAGCFLMLAVGTTALAQGGAYEAVIAVPEVAVRSGPSDKYYPTSQLRQGNKVTVRAEKDGGWLAIDPPNGSFSWVEERLLGMHSGWTAHVMAPEVPVRAGSLINDQAREVVTAQLKQGSQVVILGPAKVMSDGTKWWPIKPQNEFRFIPRSAVRRNAVVETIASKVVPPRAPVAPPGQMATADALWAQAEQARGNANFFEAKRLYEMALQQPDVGDDLRWRLASRMQSLPPAAMQPSRIQATPVPNQTTSRMPNMTGSPPVPAPPRQGQSASYGPPRGGPAAGNPNATPGRLRRAPFLIDGRQAYALEDSQGRLLMYATPWSGLNLEPYVGRNVSLVGPMVYHGQLKKNYIQVTQVVPLQ